LNSTRSITQGCWVLHLARPICNWAQHVVEPNNIGSDNLSDLHALELNT
jgi:hypothetical protein